MRFIRCFLILSILILSLLLLLSAPLLMLTAPGPEIHHSVHSQRFDDPEIHEKHSKRETLDGIITPGEYIFSSDLFNDTTFLVHWRVENGTLFMAMEAQTPGWLSIGFKPTRSMQDADQVFGWVDDNGTVYILDCYSTGRFGPHPLDEELGEADVPELPKPLDEGLFEEVEEEDEPD